MIGFCTEDLCYFASPSESVCVTEIVYLVITLHITIRDNVCYCVFLSMHVASFSGLVYLLQIVWGGEGGEGTEIQPWKSVDLSSYLYTFISFALQGGTHRVFYASSRNIDTPRNIHLLPSTLQSLNTNLLDMTR